MTKHFTWQQAVLESERTAHCKLTLMVIGSFMNQHGEGAWPAISTICRMGSMGRTSVKRALTEAEDGGWLQITRRRKENGDNLSNEYRISYPQPRTDTDLPRSVVDLPRAYMDLPPRAYMDPKHPSVFNTPENNVTGKPVPVDNSDAGTFETASAAIFWLNSHSGRNFKCTAAVVKAIKGRLADGFEPGDIMEVVERKCKEWKGTKMEQYLRPETLFNATKFAGYAGQRGMECQTPAIDEGKDCARWWESSAGISQLGAKLGVHAKTTEAFWQYKCRVAKASKQREAMDAILADMSRTGNAAYEETARYFGVATNAPQP